MRWRWWRYGLTWRPISWTVSSWCYGRWRARHWYNTSRKKVCFPLSNIFHSVTTFILMGGASSVFIFVSLSIMATPVQCNLNNNSLMQAQLPSTYWSQFLPFSPRSGSSTCYTPSATCERSAASSPWRKKMTTQIMENIITGMGTGGKMWWRWVLITITGNYDSLMQFLVHESLKLKLR